MNNVNKNSNTITEEGTFANDSNSLSINDNDIYLEVVGGNNAKGNIYGLGKLINKFMRTTRISTNLIEMSMCDYCKYLVG
ncbi:hypothetical protein CR513_03522, partial [Mucuna pruriens]